MPHLITDKTTPLLSLSHLSLYLQPCVQYWPEPGLQQYGPMEVEFLSMSADEDVITRLFRVKNVTRVSHGGSTKACTGHVVPLGGISQNDNLNLIRNALAVVLSCNSDVTFYLQYI